MSIEFYRVQVHVKLVVRTKITALLLLIVLE